MTGTQTPRIELYVRSLLPDGAHERQEAVIERLQELDAEDEIEDFSVIVWGKQIARDSAGARTEEGEYILNRVAEFKQWALSNNVSLESFYQRQTVENDVTDEPYTAMVLPVMGLAEYDGEELATSPPVPRARKSTPSWTASTAWSAANRPRSSSPATSLSSRTDPVPRHSPPVSPRGVRTPARPCDNKAGAHYVSAPPPGSNGNPERRNLQ
ncbi:HTH domain-containing protein [Halosimplex aquaticum]